MRIGTQRIGQGMTSFVALNLHSVSSLTERDTGPQVV